MASKDWKQIELVGAKIGSEDPAAEIGLYKIGEGYSDPAELGRNAILRDLYTAGEHIFMVFELNMREIDDAGDRMVYYARERMAGGELVWKLEKVGAEKAEAPAKKAKGKNKPKDTDDEYEDETDKKILDAAMAEL